MTGEIPANNWVRCRVSVIVPNYNGKELLEACLGSLLKMRMLADEIVVVDNDSKDGSEELVKQKFRSVSVLRLPSNAGFAAAVNRGVEISRGEFVAIVNNDVEVTRTWLAELLPILLEDPEIAAATGKLLFKHRPTVINDLGGIILLNGAGLQRGLGMSDRVDHERTLVGVPSGAACLIRRSDYIAVGGFDEDYFAYFEDVDLGWRLWQRRRKVVNVPKAVAYHAWRSTARKFGFQFRDYHGAKNSFANFVKNAQRSYLAQAAILWVLRLIVKEVLRLRASHQTSLPATLRASFWCVRNFPNLLASRKRIQKLRTMQDAELMRLGVLARLDYRSASPMWISLLDSFA